MIFPKSLPGFLLQQCFTLNARDRRAIRKAFRSRHGSAPPCSSGFLGMTGTTLRSLEYVPAAVSAPSRLSIQAAGSRHSDTTANALSAATDTVCTSSGGRSNNGDCASLIRLSNSGSRKHLHSTHKRYFYLGSAGAGRARVVVSGRTWPFPRPSCDYGSCSRASFHSVALQDHRDLRRYMTEATVQGFIKELLSHRTGGAMTHLEWLRRPTPGGGR